MLSHIPDMRHAPSPSIVRDDISFPLKFSNVDEAFRDFKTSIAETVKTNLDLLEEVPLTGNLCKEELIKHLRSQIESDLKEDPLYEKSVEIGRYAKNMFKAVEAYFREIFEFHENLKRELHGQIFHLSKMFLNSDLSQDFMKTISDSILAEIDYVDIFDKEIRRERRDLFVNRNNRTRFERICDLHNTWVSRFSERRNKMERERVKLIWYVDFSNSASVDDVFREKFIKTSSLDESILSEFILALAEQWKEMEKVNTTRMESSFFLPQEIDEEARTFLKMMQLLHR